MIYLAVLVIIGAALMFVASVWMAYAILTAPYICERCGRILEGPLCPECDREILAELRGEGE